MVSVQLWYVTQKEATVREQHNLVQGTINFIPYNRGKHIKQKAFVIIKLSNIQNT